MLSTSSNRKPLRAFQSPSTTMRNVSPQFPPPAVGGPLAETPPPAGRSLRDLPRPREAPAEFAPRPRLLARRSASSSSSLSLPLPLSVSSPSSSSSSSSSPSSSRSSLSHSPSSPSSSSSSSSSSSLEPCVWSVSSAPSSDASMLSSAAWPVAPSFWALLGLNMLRASSFMGSDSVFFCLPMAFARSRVMVTSSGARSWALSSRCTASRCMPMAENETPLRYSALTQFSSACRMMLQQSTQSCHFSSLRLHMALLRWHACMHFHMRSPCSPDICCSAVWSLRASLRCLSATS
mmetsp:Transcript_26023/g.66208  ORF Transcript_26023/g.66208 Transcript_26023/m.66208 type:complete len:292 (-) Transcript_26023:373-1248(-)